MGLDPVEGELLNGPPYGSKYIVGAASVHSEALLAPDCGSRADCGLWPSKGDSLVDSEADVKQVV